MLTGGAALDLARRPDISISLDKWLADIGDAAPELATMHYVFSASPAYLKAHGTPNSLASAAVKLWLIVHKEARHAARVARAAEWLRSIFDGRTNPWFRAEYVPADEFDL